MHAAQNRTRIDRVSGDDLLSLVTAPGAVPLHIGAVLMLDLGRRVTPAQLGQAIELRLPAVPRLRQTLRRVPLGCGRPIWVDDPHFSIEAHLTLIETDQVAVHDVLPIAAQQMTTTLPPDRPLWRVTVVTDVGQRRAAVILVLHHVLADGLSGLALLARLVDGPPLPDAASFPRCSPSIAALARDAAAGHLRAALSLPQTARRLMAALRELAPAATFRATPCSLNRSTSRLRRFVTVPTSLDAIADFAHDHQATVNDVLLAAVCGALRQTLASRGEDIPSFVISVPFASRDPAASDVAGNRSGVIPLLLPASGTLEQRLTFIVATTQRAKASPRGAATALLSPFFRLLATLRLYGGFINRQHLIHTFVSNVKGPPETLSLLGCQITDVIPLSNTTGNITASFTALSYAGTLTVTISADPLTCPDVSRLRDHLELELTSVGHRRPPGRCVTGEVGDLGP